MASLLLGTMRYEVTVIRDANDFGVHKLVLRPMNAPDLEITSYKLPRLHAAEVSLRGVETFRTVPGNYTSFVTFKGNELTISLPIKVGITCA